MTRSGLRTIAAIAIAVAGALWPAGGMSHVADAAGPPYPAPVEGQRVYDTAGVFAPATIARAESIIRAIEVRTGAQVAVYTQLKPESDTPTLAEADALALMNQWGVGRKGFDDGLVVLFDLDETLRHGQVQLYAGAGFMAAFLSESERQAIFDNDMLPYLRDGDMDGALLVALDRVDAAATPQHAQSLQTGRQVNALLGFGGVLFALVLFGWALWRWLRYGKDPVYLDDPSIYMPAPPPDLTPAAGALVVDGRSSRHTLTTAMLDLASRGKLAFRDESGWMSKKVGIQLLSEEPSAPARAWAQRHPLGEAEGHALEDLRRIGADEPGGYIAPRQLLEFGARVGEFDRRLEDSCVKRGWFTRSPGSVIGTWMLIGGLEITGAIVALIVGLSVPSDGLVLAGAAILLTAIATLVIAQAMPCRTMAGAMIQAMLVAYRRTLQKTLEESRSMVQVVESRVLPWLETPDQAVVWGVALGLHQDVQQVLERTVDDTRTGDGAPSIAWLPGWYVGHDGGVGVGGAIGSGGLAPGLLASSAIPNLGGMFTAIGTIGNSPSSSGGGGGGFGGGGGGGGGGAGGGF